MQKCKRNIFEGNAGIFMNLRVGCLHTVNTKPLICLLRMVNTMIQVGVHTPQVQHYDYQFEYNYG